eukprot:TRINITY_DN61736_c0_g1_i1.p1 TRINITY_DN61736_c0_g1~~TRINITY_DN61736_c0_g1_i1.p1  ORF type:complete len:243 (+),score=21.99 TRINITY_DN61736_c0_g1_i1:207-935(+)
MDAFSRFTLGQHPLHLTREAVLPGIGAVTISDLSPAVIAQEKRRQTESVVPLFSKTNTGGLTALLGFFALARRRAARRRIGHEERAIRATYRQVTATAPDVDLKSGVDQETKPKADTSREYWVVMVHAPIRNCHMPFCRLPGLRGVICTCLKDSVEPGKGIRSKDGKCALTLEQYAEVLAEGVPVLSRSKAYEVSSRLFQSAMANPVGSAVVIGSFKKAVEEYHQRLTDLGLWVSIAPVELD